MMNSYKKENPIHGIINSVKKKKIMKNKISRKQSQQMMLKKQIRNAGISKNAKNSDRAFSFYRGLSNNIRYNVRERMRIHPPILIEQRRKLSINPRNNNNYSKRMIYI